MYLVLPLFMFMELASKLNSIKESVFKHQIQRVMRSFSKKKILNWFQDLSLSFEQHVVDDSETSSISFNS